MLFYWSAATFFSLFRHNQVVRRDPSDPSQDFIRSLSLFPAHRTHLRLAFWVMTASSWERRFCTSPLLSGRSGFLSDRSRRGCHSSNRRKRLTETSQSALVCVCGPLDRAPPSRVGSTRTFLPRTRLSRSSCETSRFRNSGDIDFTPSVNIYLQFPASTS